MTFMKHFQHRFPVLIILAVVLFALAGCAGKKGAPKETADILTAKALDYYNHGKYYDALEVFKKVKERYPFSPSSLLAELKAADCHFHMKHYDQALELYMEFEKNHPTNEAVPYVLFQMGMCYFKQIDTIDRDTVSASKAVQLFFRLNRTFPKSPYQTEAKARIRKAEDFLANHELYVAKFYLRTKAVEQAKGRLQYLLATYPDSSAAPEAGKLLKTLREQAGKSTDGN